MAGKNGSRYGVRVEFKGSRESLFGLFYWQNYFMVLPGTAAADEWVSSCYFRGFVVLTMFCVSCEILLLLGQ